jgi:hypothetical protein
LAGHAIERNAPMESTTYAIQQAAAEYLVVGMPHAFPRPLN